MNNQSQPNTLQQQLEQALQRYAALQHENNLVLTDVETIKHILSHDLKAPVRGIFSLSQWLLEDYDSVLDDRGQDFLRLIQARTQQLTAMLDASLAYSKIGHSKEPSVPINLYQLVDSIIASYGIVVNVQMQVEDDLPLICTDANCVEQLFTHLIINAIESIDKGSQGEINIGWEDDEQDWRFHVADNGVGIPERNFEDIFNLFYSLDEKKRENGGGVGLAFAQKIVAMMRGRIWLQSEVGVGTTFYFTIPKRECVE